MFNLLAMLAVLSNDENAQKIRKGDTNAKIIKNIIIESTNTGKWVSVETEITDKTKPELPEKNLIPPPFSSRPKIIINNETRRLTPIQTMILILREYTANNGSNINNADLSIIASENNLRPDETSLALKSLKILGILSTRSGDNFFQINKEKFGKF